MRRPESLHPAALLIDEHGGVSPPQWRETRNQRVDLRRRLDIAFEKDQSERIAVAEEGTLLRCQCFALAAADEGAAHGINVSRPIGAAHLISHAPESRRRPWPSVFPQSEMAAVCDRPPTRTRYTVFAPTLA